MSLSVDLTHSFPGFRLRASFTAPPGVTALFGRSGSGKTTVVNALAGLLRPDEGRIALEGRVLLDTAAGLSLPPHKRRIGYVFQDARLFPHLTVRQNLLYGRWFAPRGPDAASFEKIVSLLGLDALLARRPGALSGGEKSRVGIGRAILSRPQLLLMDEPLAALDEARKEEILPYLERLRDELALPVLYVSHSLAEVARLATTVIVMEAGQVKAAGPAADILSQPGLTPALGLREAGAVLTATVAAPEPDALTRLSLPAGTLFVPELAVPPGRTVRVRVMAQDVMIALRRPEGISALNLLPVTVQEIRQGQGPGAMLRLDCGGQALLARLTQRSVTALDLRPGQRVYAVLKAVSVAPGAIGAGEAPVPGTDPGWQLDTARDL